MGVATHGSNYPSMKERDSALDKQVLAGGGANDADNQLLPGAIAF